MLAWVRSSMLKDSPEYWLLIWAMRSIREMTVSASFKAAERVAVYAEEVLMKQSVRHLPTLPWVDDQTLKNNRRRLRRARGVE